MGYREFWTFYEPSIPRPVKNGIRAKSQRGAIGETWWSRRWIAVLESFGMGPRLARGRSYARRGQVVSMDVEKGSVTARVQGSRPKPYSIGIKLKPLSDAEWDKVADAMASQAVFAARLLSGEMPQNVEEAFSQVKVSLFPKSMEELTTDCSCPDYANPCKHIAAVYYLLAERFDEDPFLIFKLRGRTREELMDMLRQKRSLATPERDVPEAAGAVHHDQEGPILLEDCLDTFWQAGPEVASFSVNPAPPDIDNAIIKRLGDAPFTVGKQNVTSILARVYTTASAAALRKAREMSGDRSATD